MMAEKSECLKCKHLIELYERTPKSNRDYWLMTEIFVLLHGSDICKGEETTEKSERCPDCKAKLIWINHKKAYCLDGGYSGGGYICPNCDEPEPTSKEKKGNEQ